MATCANPACTIPEFTPGPRRGKPQTFCGRPCQITAANARRATTRAGRRDNLSILRDLSTRVDAPGQAKTLGATVIPPSVDRSPSESPSARLATLLAKARSREGVSAFEIAEIARARNISPWAPLRVIIAP